MSEIKSSWINITFPDLTEKHWIIAAITLIVMTAMQSVAEGDVVTVVTHSLASLGGLVGGAALAKTKPPKP